MEKKMFNKIAAVNNKLVNPFLIEALATDSPKLDHTLGITEQGERLRDDLANNKVNTGYFDKIAPYQIGQLLNLFIVSREFASYELTFNDITNQMNQTIDYLRHCFACISEELRHDVAISIRHNDISEFPYAIREAIFSYIDPASKIQMTTQVWDKEFNGLSKASEQKKITPSIIINILQFNGNPDDFATNIAMLITQSIDEGMDNPEIITDIEDILKHIEDEEIDAFLGATQKTINEIASKHKNRSPILGIWATARETRKHERYMRITARYRATKASTTNTETIKKSIEQAPPKVAQAIKAKTPTLETIKPAQIEAKVLSPLDELFAKIIISEEINIHHVAEQLNKFFRKDSETLTETLSKKSNKYNKLTDAEIEGRIRQLCLKIATKYVEGLKSIPDEKNQTRILATVRKAVPYNVRVNHDSYPNPIAGIICNKLRNAFNPQPQREISKIEKKRHRYQLEELMSGTRKQGNTDAMTFIKIYETIESLVDQGIYSAEGIKDVLLNWHKDETKKTQLRATIYTVLSGYFGVEDINSTENGMAKEVTSLIGKETQPNTQALRDAHTSNSMSSHERKRRANAAKSKK